MIAVFLWMLSSRFLGVAIRKALRDGHMIRGFQEERNRSSWASNGKYSMDGCLEMTCGHSSDGVPDVDDQAIFARNDIKP